MSLKKNILKNGIASTIQKLIRIAEQLILVPFFITAWGAEYYGEWLTLTIIPSILAFSDLGFGTSAANKFLLEYAAGNKKDAANTARNGLFIITLIILFGIFLSFSLLFILDYYKVFDKSLINKHDAILAVSFLMIARLLNFYQQLYEAFYKAARRASLSINLFSLYSLINIIGGISVLILGKGIVAFALINLLVAISFNPFYVWKARTVLPLRKTHHGLINKNIIKSIASNGLGYLLSPTWQAIYFQGTTFVVRLTLGPVAVTIFNTIRTVTNSVNQAFSLLISTTFPEFQFEIGAKDLYKARKIFRVTFGLNIIIAAAGMLFLYFWGPWFYQIWTRKALDPPTAMWNIFILSIGFNVIWWTTIIIFQAFNKPFQFTIAGAICAIISVISSYYLSIAFGLTGAAIGSLILNFLLAIYILPIGCKLLGQSMKTLIQDIIQDIIQISKSFILRSNRFRITN